MTIRLRRRHGSHLPGAPKLHVGCGPSAIEGWWNVDIRPFPAVDETLDVTAPWPYPDSSLDYVFAEHFIEHIELYEALVFLEETRRCLKPDGRIRLSTPALERVLVRHRGFTAERERQVADTLEMNRAFHGWGHRFLYSREMLSHILEQSGFARIEYFGYGESEDENLRNLEKHGGYFVAGGYPTEWIVEAVRGSGMAASSAEFREWLEAEYFRYVRSGH